MPDALHETRKRMQELLREALRLAEALPSAEAVQDALAAYQAHHQDTEHPFRIERYRHTRHWALYEGGELLAVTVYRKGAEAVRDRLQAQEARREQLTPPGAPEERPKSRGAVARLQAERTSGRKRQR